MVQNQSERIGTVIDTNIMIEERNDPTDRVREIGNGAESGAGLEKRLATDAKMDIEMAAAKGAEMVGAFRMIVDAMTEIDETASGLEAERSIAHAEVFLPYQYILLSLSLS